jgi:hypothetical protein
VSTAKTVEQHSREYTQKRLRTNAIDLRELADVFDKVAVLMDRVGTPGHPNYSTIAAEAVHEHAAWLMNAHLDTVMRYAAEADVARAQGK